MAPQPTAAEISAGLRQLADWLDEVSDRIDKYDLGMMNKRVLQLYGSGTPEAYAEKVALLGTVDEVTITGGLVYTERHFGAVSVAVIAGQERVIRESEKTEWREVPVGRPEFVDELAHLNPLLEQEES